MVSFLESNDKIGDDENGFRAEKSTAKRFYFQLDKTKPASV